MARRRAEPGVDRRQQILEAALDVFAEVGFEAATTKEIADRADVTQGLIYFYFKQGKEELFSAAFDHQAAIALEQLGIEDLGRDDSPEVVIPRVLSRFVEVMSAPRFVSVVRLMARATVSDDKCGPRGIAGHERFRVVGHRIIDRLTAYLDAQVAIGSLRPVNTALIAQLMMTSMVMVMARRARGDEYLPDLPPETFATSIADVFLHGLLTTANEPGPLAKRSETREKVSIK